MTHSLTDQGLAAPASDDQRRGVRKADTTLWGRLDCKGSQHLRRQGSFQRKWTPMQPTREHLDHKDGSCAHPHGVARFDGAPRPPSFRRNPNPAPGAQTLTFLPVKRRHVGLQAPARGPPRQPARQSSTPSRQRHRAQTVDPVALRAMAADPRRSRSATGRRWAKDGNSGCWASAVFGCLAAALECRTVTAGMAW
jgi:hypothetical protein